MTRPGLFEVIIALIGGIAGVIGQTRKEKVNTIIPGVAIATSLMPPLCTCGYGLATWNLRILSGAAYLFLVNSYFIILGAALVLNLFKIPHVDDMTEEEAVAAVGNTNEIAQRIHTEAAVQAPQQGVRVWLILLLVLGSPLWLSLYAALWAVIISLWAVFVSFAAVSLSGYVAAPAFGVHGNFPMAAASLGAGLFMTGCTIFLFFGCLAASKGVCRLTKKIFAGIRRSDGKERLQ